MYRDNLADTSHRGGVVQARSGNLEGAQASLELSLRRAYEMSLAASSEVKIGLGAQAADIEADLGNVLRIIAVNDDDEEARMRIFAAANSSLRHAERESIHIVNVYRAALGEPNRQDRRDIRENETISGKVLSNLGRLALTLQLSDGTEGRDSVMGRALGRRGYFNDARRHLRAGDNGFNLVENDLWAMAGARINGERAQHASVEFWRRNLISDLGWTLLRDTKNFVRASRLAFNIGRTVIRGEQASIDTFVRTF